MAKIIIGMSWKICIFAAAMRRYALIGRRLGHSWSQRWFEGLFDHLGLVDCAYELKELASLVGLRQWVECEWIAGFNVTVPYKREVIPYLDALDPVAEAVGAVNCVSVEQGRLMGHNTDAPAFLDTVKKSKFEIQNCLILGTGGAAQAVAYAMHQLGVEPLLVSRNPQNIGQMDYRQLATFRLQAGTLLVNATPVGMHPDVNGKLLELSSLYSIREVADRCMVYDLVYNPSPTVLLREAAALGMRTCDGLPMLERQAELSWEIWRRNI